MFSVWRKLTGKQDGKPIFPSGVAPIGESMQKKYAKGVQYNMKIIIKGDRNTGKSALFQRLNGKGFIDEYIPTHEIQVTNVNWNYQGAADIVKVEVWDIVDKSEKKKGASGDSLKIVNDDEEEQNEASNGMMLDAEFLNVFKGTHGVILTLDITKVWTWTYVQRELEKIPHSIPVLVLGNFRDIEDRRVVQTDEIIAHIEHLDRPTGSAEVYFTESSMKDGYGLHFTYKFLNMPFLILQRETLLKQLEANTLEIEETRESLAIQSIYEDGSYTNFKEMLSNKDNPDKAEEIKSEDTNEAVDMTEIQPTENPPADTTVSNVQQPPPLAKLDISGKKLPVATVSPTVHSVDSPKESVFKTYTKKIFGGDSSASNAINDSNGLSDEPGPEPDANSIGEFDTGQLPSDFLDHSNKSAKGEKLKVDPNRDDDSDDGNPMVADYADLDDNEMKTFEDELSDEGEFEDLSDDERRELKQPGESIIEKIKSERINTNNMLDSNSHTNDVYNDLDSDNNAENIDVSNEQCDVEVVDTYTVQTTECTPRTENGLDTPPTPSSTSTTKDLNSSNVRDNSTVKLNDSGIKMTVEKEESEDEVDCSDEVYIITGDIDVEEDPSWLVEENGDHEVKPKPSTSSKNDSVNTPASNGLDLNFEVDELEMFMKNQLEKRPSAVEEDLPKPVVEPPPSESDRPKKKKKKKKTDEGEPVVNGEKKKKKKVVNPDVTSDNQATGSETIVKKTKKSKSASSDGKSTTTTTTEKEKKSKKTRKKDKPDDIEKCEKSELDSFYEGL